MKKRTLSLLLAVACALSLALSGCGGAPAPDAQTSAPAGSETPAAVDQTREIVFRRLPRPVPWRAGRLLRLHVPGRVGAP